MYYLIWQYHDLYFENYDNYGEVIERINNLRAEYCNDLDFKYKLIQGNLIMERG